MEHTANLNDDPTAVLFRKCTALTGGIATGKSTVAEILRSLGAGIVDTDAIAREVVLPGSPVMQKIAQAFGKEFILADGSLDRPLMRGAIIGSPEQRELLNGITHPAIMEVTRERIFGLLREGACPVIVDVPLLYETGWDRHFTAVVLVYVPEAVQIDRLMRRDGLDRDTAAATLAAQIGIEKKKSRAGIIIDNSGTIESTEEQVRKIFPLLEKTGKNIDSPHPMK